MRYSKLNLASGGAGIRSCLRLLLLGLLLIPTPRLSAEPGDLDLSFGNSGKVIAGVGGGYAVAYATAVQSDGKLILAGFENPRYVRPFNLASGGDFLLARFTTNNQLDATFGVAGKVVTQVSTNYPRHNSSEIRAIRVLADGKILVAGHSFQNPDYTDFTLARYHSDGSLDTTFGTDGTGIVSTDFGQHARINSMVIQGDGRIVVAGYITDEISGPDGFALARYTTNGVLDSTFGSGGTVTSPGTYYIANALTIQSDGKIVAVGEGIPSGSRNHVAVFRYTTNGILDPAFGGGTGKVFTRVSANISNFDNSANAVAMQSGLFIGDEDKILVAGSHSDSTSGNRSYQTILRYLLDGTLDSTFANGGILTNAVLPDTGQQQAISISIQGLSPSRRRITIGGSGYASSQYYFTLARFNNVGAPVTTFGENGTGKTLFPIAPGFQTNGYAYAMTIQSGQYVLAGTRGVTSGESAFAATRFSAAGLVDTNFGNGGLLVAELSDAPAASANGVAIQADGKIVAAGASPPLYDFNSNSDQQSFALVRFHSDGALDTSFGIGGKVRTKIGSNDLAYAVAVQPDGKIVAAGTSYTSGNNQFAVVRYNEDGSLDNSFGNGGKATALVGPSQSTAHAVRIQSDGKIVVAGDCANGGFQQFALARFTTNGALDTTFGSGGKVQTSISTTAFGYGIGTAPDQKIVAAGFAARIEGSTVISDFAAARYQTNGALDFSFGSLGRSTANVGGGTVNVGYGMAVQPDGKIIVAGGAGLGGFPGPVFGTEGVNSFLALVRFNTDGTPDSSFGSGGSVITQVGAFSDFATSITLQPDGKILVAGGSQSGTYKFFALRYTTNGIADGTYGTGGAMLIDFGTGTNEVANALELDANGRAVLAGNVGGLFGLARLEGDFVVTPSLNIFLTATNTAIVSWPYPSAGWSLQNNTTLTGSAWSSVTQPLNNDGTNNFTIINPPSESRFFRLFRP